MKSLIRWSVTLGLVCGTWLGVPIINNNMEALALTEEQVEEKLSRVPVFVIMTPEGSPLIRSVTEGENNIPVTDVFFSGEDARQVINELRSLTPNNPSNSQEVERTERLVELAQSLKVQPFPLALIYQELRENADQPDRLRFAFNPNQQDLNAAQNLIGDEEELQAVPLFMIRVSQDEGYASVVPSGNEEDDPIVPAFFSQAEAQNLLNQVQEKYPAAAIQVVDITSIISTMLRLDEEWLDRVELIPPQQAIQDARSLTPANAP